MPEYEQRYTQEVDSPLNVQACQVINCDAARIGSLRDVILSLEEKIVHKIELQSTKYASYWSSL